MTLIRSFLREVLCSLPSRPNYHHLPALSKRQLCDKMMDAIYIHLVDERRGEELNQICIRQRINRLQNICIVSVGNELSSFRIIFSVTWLTIIIPLCSFWSILLFCWHCDGLNCRLRCFLPVIWHVLCHPMLQLIVIGQPCCFFL